MSGFHGAFATGVASQQGTLTLPDTWFRPPFWDLLMLQLLRPNSSNLPCLYSTFHLEYPLVLSRFYLLKQGSGFVYVMVDFICIDLVELRGTRSKRELQNEKKNLAQSGIRTYNLLLTSPTRYPLRHGYDLILHNYR